MHTCTHAHMHTCTHAHMHTCTKKDLFHLNQTEQCTGRYTFISKNGKSSIDHILVNEVMMDKYIAMHIDEDRVQLDISDHCTVRAWFKMGNRGESKKESWKKTKYKDIPH